jgi:hypothetical protein
MDIRMSTKRYRRTSGVSEEGLAELGQRLAAAYISYVSGHKGVDRLLKKAPKRIGVFWTDLADAVFTAMKAGSSVEDLRFRDVITKFIQ